MASSEHAARWLAGDVAQALGRLAEGGSNLDQLGGAGVAVELAGRRARVLTLSTSSRRWRGRGGDLDPARPVWTARRSRQAARVALQISTPLKDADRHWVRTYCATSLPEVEKGAWRALALRQTGNIAGAAALLGMGHTSLGEWLHRRRTEHTRRDREKPERARPGPARRDPLAETRRILREARALRNRT